MTPERILECSFFIPLHRDKEIGNGQLHPTTVWSWLNNQLYQKFEGRTVAPGLYQGVWKSPRTGQPIADESYRYLVAIPESRVGELQRLLAQACAEFQQQMIYLSVAGQVYFIEATGNDEAL